eukprot:scaffold18507_cov188-Amphora_coffeaeformis.AAC.2
MTIDQVAAVSILLVEESSFMRMGPIRRFMRSWHAEFQSQLMNTRRTRGASRRAGDCININFVNASKGSDGCGVTVMALCYISVGLA